MYFLNNDSDWKFKVHLDGISDDLEGRELDAPNIQTILISENITSLNNKDSENNIEMSHQTINKMISKKCKLTKRGIVWKNLIQMYIECN